MSIDTAILIDDNERLAAELASVTETVVRPVVRRQLHVTLSESDLRARNQDAIELVGDIQVLLIAALDGPRNNGSGPIRDLRGYAAQVATNTCYLYLRHKFPERTRQKNKLRYALKHMPGIDVWQTEDGLLLCGLENCDRDDAPAEITIDTEPGMLATRAGYLDAVRQAVVRAGAPVDIDQFVACLMETQGLREASMLSIGTSRDGHGEIAADDLAAPSSDGGDISAERLQTIWREVTNLSLRHRKALLLNLKHKGSDLLRAFPVCGIATLREIAGALELEENEMAGIWPTLPWDDLAIAAHLGVTRQQVINLRQTARARLHRALRD